MDTLFFEPARPVVETKFGKLRGVTYGGVQCFMGVKYADAPRFRMPAEQQPWEGIRNAYKYGHVSPLMVEPEPPNFYRGLFLHQKAGEDCQNLNIWAPVSKKGEKKPVFVWFHGGGFMAGSSMEEYSFDGFPMARGNDVVFVSVNHRLNILGYLNLTEFGEEFADTPNLGIADLAAAMKWIHENIAAFGGDPENVTICGHSGGGAKVMSMFQLEQVAPWFARGIVLSGVTPDTFGAEPEDTVVLAREMLAAIGITRENIHEVYTVPYARLVEGYQTVAMRLWQEGRSVMFEPQKNSWFPGFPHKVGFAPGSAKKPLIISTTLGEFGRAGLSIDEKCAMTEADKLSHLEKMYGANAARLEALFRQAYPTHDILDLAYLDAVMRKPAWDCAMKRAAEGSKNTYLMMNAYNMAEDMGIPMWHGGEVCYLFGTQDRVLVANEAVDGPRKCALYSRLVRNYCYTGDPNCQELPHWEPFTPEHPVTMVVDREPEVKEAYDIELMALLTESVPPLRFPPQLPGKKTGAQLGID